MVEAIFVVVRPAPVKTTEADNKNNEGPINSTVVKSGVDISSEYHLQTSKAYTYPILLNVMT